MLYLLSSHGFVHEDLGHLNRAITIAEGLDQDAVLCSDNPTDLISSTRILAMVHRKKVTFLCRIQGYQCDDLAFLQQTVDINRKLVQRCLDDPGLSHDTTITAKDNLGRVLITHGAAMFSDIGVREGLAIRKEILDARQVTKKHKPDAIPLLRTEAEMCHAQTLLSEARKISTRT